MASSVVNAGRLFWRSGNKLQRFAAPVALNATQQRHCKCLKGTISALESCRRRKTCFNVSLTLG